MTEILRAQTPYLIRLKSFAIVEVCFDAIFTEEKMKRNWMFLFGLVLLVLAVACQTAPLSKLERPTTPGKYRAFWVNAFEKSLHTPAGVAKVLKTARDYNYNTVLPEVRLQCDAFYNSNVEPKSPLVRPSDYDPLADLCQQAHDTSNGKQRLEVHAWIVTYRTDLQMSNVPIGTSGPEHVLKQHPGWINQNFKGETLLGGRKYLDPGVPGVIDHIVSVVTDIVENYDVDGVHFDYIRYPEETTSGACDWGYNPISVRRFNHLYNRMGTPETGDDDWEQFRRQQVIDLLRKVYVESKRVDPKVRLSASTINWGSYDGDFTKSASYTRTLQDWVGFMREGVLDINFLMNYKREFDEGQAQDYREWSKLLAETKNGHHAVSGQGAYLNETEDTIAQMRSDLSNPEIDGVCTYCYTQPRKDRSSAVVPDEAFYSAVRAELFSEPLHTPPAEWLDNPSTGILGGYVKVGNDAGDGAKVVLKPGGKVTKTDGTGFFAFLRLAPGKYTVSVKALPGIEIQEPVTETARVKAGEVSMKTLHCKP